MSRTMWLIVESDKDGLIFQAILKKIQPDVRVKYRRPSGARGGISRLANQLHELIEEAINQQPMPDCIVVLYDSDEHTQPDRRDYEHIEETCKRYADAVIRIVARDEIEAWLMAHAKTGQS